MKTDTTPYLCFPPSTPEETARAVFQKRYGFAPERVFVHLGLLRVGPVPERNEAARNGRPVAHRQEAYHASSRS